MILDLFFLKLNRKWQRKSDKSHNLRPSWMMSILHRSNKQSEELLMQWLEVKMSRCFLWTSSKTWKPALSNWRNLFICTWWVTLKHILIKPLLESTLLEKYFILISKDAVDKTNPFLRALAVRTMGCIRINEITEYLCDPLKKALRDEDPYVRKTGALCVPKLYEISPTLI